MATQHRATPTGQPSTSAGSGSPAADHSGDAVGHGNSPAAWIAVGIIVLGALLGSIAFVVAEPWLFFVGLGVIVIGAIAGKVLTAMGFGEKPHE